MDNDTYDSRRFDDGGLGAAPRPNAAPRPAVRQEPEIPLGRMSARPAPAGYGEPDADYTPPRSAAAPAAIAAAANVPVTNPQTDPNLIEFSRSYDAHGREVSSMRFRAPTGRDIAQCGMPMRFVKSDDPTVPFEYKVVSEIVAKYIVQLSDNRLPRSTVDKFEMKDWNACSNLITGFFLQ